MEQLKLGKSSILFKTPVFFRSCASATGPKEGDGPLKDYFDLIFSDSLLGTENWESAESTLQIETALYAIKKASLAKEQIHLAIGGDLLAQTIASSFGIASLNIPYFGLYGACSTIGEALIIASLILSAKYGENILCFSSSHFGSAEKEFRFPLSYGNQRPFSSTWTVTGSGACILTNKSSSLNTSAGSVVISGATIGELIDFGIKDSLNMGACMAPAACDTICKNFQDFNRTPEDYDLIFTGDLGIIGKKILLDLLAEKGFDISDKHKDCGLLIYDNKAQDTHAGGSGGGCPAVVLCSYIIPKVSMGYWKRVLFVPTGALLSKVSFNEGQSVPGIAHGIVIEHYSN